MTIAAQSLFPSVDSIMQLARVRVNDTFPGINNTQGRVLTNAAPFTIPMLNSALSTLQRMLRNEGVTFLIQDNFLLPNVTPVVRPDPNVQIFIGYNGYFDGTTMHAAPSLPNDMMQPYMVEEQTTGSGLAFTEMVQPQGGIESCLQGSYLGVWEWRAYRIYMLGSTVNKTLRLRYKSTQMPLDLQPEDFPKTNVNIIDSEEALACDIAAQYADARGADSQRLIARRDEAIFDMANEWVRRSQSVNYRRRVYAGSSGGTNLGQTSQDI
jgi:hypothetical protein